MQVFLYFLGTVMIGGLLGWYAASAADGWGILVPLAELWSAYYLHVILHEAGHLLCGRLCGYTLTSFRIGKWMLVRREGRWTFSRFHIPGTGGQCLMCPPEGDDSPIVLYNLGGGLLNLVTAGLAGPLGWLCPLPRLVRSFFVLFAVFGVLSGLANLLPMRVGGLDNDGRNALTLGKHPLKRWALAVQLRINAAQAQGKALSELPEEFFAPLDSADWNDPLVGAVACIYAGYKMEREDFAGAKADLDRLLDCPKLNAIHRYECVLEQRCCRLLLGETELDPLEKPVEKFRKATRRYFIARLRQECIQALFLEHDLEKAQKIREELEKRGQKYPYPGEIAGEKAMLDRTLATFKKSSESRT